jgi:hypothetical protein
MDQLVALLVTQISLNDLDLASTPRSMRLPAIFLPGWTAEVH